jgi:AbrB family looped-hinge helix DNA binding protein
VVIPAEARRDFGMKEGEMLLVIAGRRRRGLTLVKAEYIEEFAHRLLAEIEEGEKGKP